MSTTLRRCVGLLLVLCMVLAQILVPSPIHVHADAAEASTGTRSTVDSTLAEYVQDGCTLQCWNWSLANIEANMGLIANMGYSTIQISPLQETKEATENKPYDNWWVVYQPISFNINEGSGNAVGTRDELISLCETAHKYDIKVIVDVVSNHLANNGSGVISPMIAADIRDDSSCWHTNYGTNSPDYYSRYNVTQYSMGGLPDLNTGSDKIQNYVLELLKDYIDCGVDGFRFDAAKQIETPEDDSSFASDFWPTVVNGANDYASSTRGTMLYCYGELLGGTDENNSLPISAYTQYMSVTDSVWSNDVRYKLQDSSAASLQSSYFKSANADKLVLWAESHDTFGDGSSTSTSSDILLRAWALVASRAYTMSLYFPRANDLVYQEMGQVAKTGWSSDAVKAINRFHNHFIGQSEYLTQDGTGNYYYNERGNSGIMVVNFSGGSRWVDIPVYAMASGTYTDQISGNTFTVSGGRLTGQMGDTGVACVYNPTTVSCSHASHGSDGYCYDCYEYVGHSSGTTCSVCGTASTRTLYFKNSGSWSNVYLYGWHDNGTTVTSGWPGTAMTLVDGETDIYQITVPVTATNVIFNDGDGTQTANLTPAADEDTYDQASGFWSTYGVVDVASDYYLIGNINGADFNGYDYHFEDGSLTMTFDSTSYVFVLDSYGVEYMTDGWAGEVTSVDMYPVTTLTEPNKLMVPAGTVTFDLVINSDGTVTLSYTASESGGSGGSGETEDPVTDRVIYFKNTSGWSKPYIYAWNASGDVTNAWPGNAMTLVDGETDIYSYTLSVDATQVIFTNNGSSQTADLTIPTDGKDMYTLSSNSWSTYGEDSGETTVDYYLFGYINGANYGCEDDYANLGEYKFVDGTLTTTFDADSYVGIKTGDNANWYMTQAYVSTTTGTFYNTSTGAAEKMLIPGGVEVTMTLTVNSDSTLTLSYVTASTECSHSYDSGVVTTEATCLTAGVKTYTCSACGTTKTEEIAATGHSYTVTVVDPTCENNGYTTHKCDNCDYSYNDTAVNPTGHSYDSGVVTTEATCLTAGVKTYTCSACGATKTQEIAATGHSYTVTVVDPTCENNGYTTHKCDNCDYSYNDTAVNPIGHSYDSGVVTTEATCLTAGVKTYTCSACGTTKTQEIAATGHSYTVTVVDPTCENNGYTTHKCDNCGYSYNDTAVNPIGHNYSSVVTAPTCTEKGYTTYTCSNCGDVYTWNETAATGHSYSGGTCTTCGEADPDYAPDYYLFGYINGADYGIGDDIDNLGEYKFVDGTLTVKFTEESYVAVKTSDNINFYMTNGYVGAATSTILYKFTDPYSVSANKLMVPGGQTVTFTLTENWDGNLILSYTVDSSDCVHTSHSTDGVCSTCGATVEHTYSLGVCTVCGAQDPDYVAYDYYLFGYINGANYGCEEDASNLGDYIFVDGKLTVTFTSETYVGVKEVNPGAKYGAEVVAWYMTDGYVGEVTTATLYDSTTLTSADKLYVPAGVVVTFTMTKNDDGTVTLSYETTQCEHTYGEGVVTTEATCLAAGVKTYTCSACGATKTEEIAATGHSYTVTVVDPTCENNGYTTHKCTSCGYSYNDTAVNPIGHNYSTVVTAPTCTEVGYTTYTCSNCGDVYTWNETAATGHSYSEGSCTVCGEADPDYSEPTVDYYLFGYINGANYACEEDWENLGEYKFVSGKLTATFDVDSYVAIKTGDNANWYMTQTYVSTTSGTFYNTTTGTSEKMLVPGGVQVTFTLVENSDGSLTLSYVTASTECDHNYVDGTCSICGAADPDATVTDPGLTLKYPSLSFEDEIFYNVYFTVGDMTSVEEMGLMLLSSRQTDATIDDAIGTVPGYTTNGTIYMVRSEGIAAAYMGDTMYFKVYAKLSDGSYAYSTAGGYNAKAYANTVLSGSYTDEMKSLVVAMVNYGAEAQLYFGHNTTALVNAALTDEQKALVASYDETMVDAVVSADSSKTANFVRVSSNFKSLYPSVSFDSAFSINFYCTPAITVDDGMTLYYWDAETYNSITEFTVDNATGSMEMTATNGQYWGNVPGIAAKDMDKTYYVSCVFESEGETITTGIIAYSLGKYCEGKAATDGDAQQAFAQATAVYGYYAKQYFASIA